MSVLDASALPAYLFDKLGAPVVTEIIDTACISSVNLSEVATRLAHGEPVFTADRVWTQLDIGAEVISIH
jgi:PIN domain nuclease of toxin-antitoxin system